MAFTSNIGNSKQGVDCPLLHLDPVAQATLVGLLPGDQLRMLRLTSKATQRMVDRWTTKLSIASLELQQRDGQLEARFPALAQLVVLGNHLNHVHLPALQSWSTVTSVVFHTHNVYYKHRHGNENWPDLAPSIAQLFPKVRELRPSLAGCGAMQRR